MEARPDLRVLLLTGAGQTAFAAGTDISRFRALSTPEDAIGYEERGAIRIAVLEKCRLPMIAAVAGGCTASSAAITGACDVG